jgi:hypothetical protein
MTVLERAMHRLEGEFAERPMVFSELSPFLVGEAKGCTARDAAARLGLREEAVRTTIFRMRRRCRELVREEIAATVASRADIEEEYQALLSTLRSQT